MLRSHYVSKAVFVASPFIRVANEKRSTERHLQRHELPIWPFRKATVGRLHVYPPEDKGNTLLQLIHFLRSRHKGKQRYNQNKPRNSGHCFASKRIGERGLCRALQPQQKVHAIPLSYEQPLVLPQLPQR